MHKFFLLIIILTGLLSCKNKENYSEKVRLSSVALKSIPRKVLTAPFKRIIKRQFAEMRVYMDSSAFNRKALPLKRKLDFEDLERRTDSLFIHMVSWDSLNAYAAQGKEFAAFPNPEEYHPADKRLLAMATDMGHDSLLQACSRAWKRYFSALETAFLKTQRRLFTAMVRLHQNWNPRNRNLKAADIEFVVSTESARFIKSLKEGYVVALVSQLQDNGQLKNGCSRLRDKGAIYFSRVYLDACNTVLENMLNGATRTP